MAKQELYIAFCDFGDIDKTLFEKVLTDYCKINHRSLKIVSNLQGADYVIYSVFGHSHIYVPDNCIKIFFTGENLRPDFNLCDYAIGFDFMEYGDRYHRFPFYYLNENISKSLSSKKKYSIKSNVCGGGGNKDFCSFTVSNGSNANGIRAELFHELSKYKKVDSGGAFLNNIGGRIDDKFAFDSKHKFSICCENSSYPGYTTEKIVEAFAAGAIPIYWGDPFINKVFNEKAFINVMDYKDIISVVERVKIIDNTPAEYEKMVNEPPLICDDYTFEVQYHNLFLFFESIFQRSLDEAQRYPRVAFTKVYQYQMRKLYLDHQKMQRIRRIYSPIKRSLGK